MILLHLVMNGILEDERIYAFHVKREYTVKVIFILTIHTLYAILFLQKFFIKQILNFYVCVIGENNAYETSAFKSSEFILETSDSHHDYY